MIKKPPQNSTCILTKTVTQKFRLKSSTTTKSYLTPRNESIDKNQLSSMVNITNLQTRPISKTKSRKINYKSPLRYKFPSLVQADYNFPNILSTPKSSAFLFNGKKLYIAKNKNKNVHLCINNIVLDEHINNVPKYRKIFVNQNGGYGKLRINNNNNNNNSNGNKERGHRRGLTLLSDSSHKFNQTSSNFKTFTLNSNEIKNKTKYRENSKETKLKRITLKSLTLVN